jgi:hypothetical protein
MPEAQKQSAKESIESMDAKMLEMAKILGAKGLSEVQPDLATDNLLSMGLFFVRSMREMESQGNLTSSDVQGASKIINEIERYYKKTGLFTADHEESYKIRTIADNTKWSRQMADRIMESLTGVVSDVPDEVYSDPSDWPEG